MPIFLYLPDSLDIIRLRGVLPDIVINIGFPSELKNEVKKMDNIRISGLIIFLLIVAFPFGNASCALLTAGDVDDNLNFGFFNNFLGTMQDLDLDEVLPRVQLDDRVTFRILDADENVVSNAYVSITPEGGELPLIETYAGSNGIFRFFPTIDSAGDEVNFTVTVTAPDRESSEVILDLNLDDLNDNRVMNVMLEDYKTVLPDSLDLMFVVDTTGSMSDELSYLTTEFKTIIGNISEEYPGVSMRYGLVVYRDTGDEYVVRSYEFTDSLDIMQGQLSDQEAGGGGDLPEAMDQALEKASECQWRDGNTVRLMFLIADAPPHSDKLQDTLDHVYEARKKGIHIHPLVASGAGNTAEYILRTAACLTHGRYLFLTDDSGIGDSHGEPHLPGFIVTTLENLFVRVVKSELSGRRVEPANNDIIRTVGRVVDGVALPVVNNDPEDEKNENNETRSVTRGGDSGNESYEDWGGGGSNDTDEAYTDDVSEPDGELIYDDEVSEVTPELEDESVEMEEFDVDEPESDEEIVEISTEEEVTAESDDEESIEEVPDDIDPVEEIDEAVTEEDKEEAEIKELLVEEEEIKTDEADESEEPEEILVGVIKVDKNRTSSQSSIQHEEKEIISPPIFEIALVLVAIGCPIVFIIKRKRQ